MVDLNALKELLEFCKNNIIITILFLLVLLFINTIIYKNSNILKWMFNKTSNIIGFKQKHVIYNIGDDKGMGVSEIKKQYVDEGYKYFYNSVNNLKCESNLYIEHLEKYLKKRISIIEKAKRKLKNFEGFIYTGFSYIPFAVLDGYKIFDTIDVSLYSFNDGRVPGIGRGWFELFKRYNADIIIENDTRSEDFNSLYSLNHEEVILKVELTTDIANNKIYDAISEHELVTIKINHSVSNYAEIEKVQEEFKYALDKLNSCNVKTIHLFISAPTFVTFSLGRQICNYHPDIIVYQFLHGKYKWGINIHKEELVDCSNKS